MIKKTGGIKTHIVQWMMVSVLLPLVARMVQSIFAQLNAAATRSASPPTTPPTVQGQTIHTVQCPRCGVYMPADSSPCSCP